MAGIRQAEVKSHFWLAFLNSTFWREHLVPYPQILVIKHGLIRLATDQLYLVRDLNWCLSQSNFHLCWIFHHKFFYHIELQKVSKLLKLRASVIILDK